MPANRPLLFLLSALAATLAICVAGYSMFDPGVYVPSTPVELLPGATSQDLVSVVAGIGVIVCILLIRRGWKGAWLIWAGLLGYLFYAYALYAFERVYNPLFLCYIAILGLVIYALAFFFRGIDPVAVRPRRDRTPPRRSTALLFLLLVVLFAGLWLSMLLPAMAARVPPSASTIFVLDLAIFLPLMSIEAALLLRKHPLADLLAVPILVKIGTLGVSVMLSIVFAPAYGQPADLSSVAIYALLGLGPLALAFPYLRALEVN